MKKKTKFDLFTELAKPDDEGYSMWVDVSEFTGDYEELALGNGGSWCRKESKLANRYVVEFDKEKNPGNSIDRIRLNGLNNEDLGTQNIRSDIKKMIKNQRCVMLGVSRVEVDHKNGRKDDQRVMNPLTQRISDFQPLSKAANDAKRQFCKGCKNTGVRFDAKKLGYPISVVGGTLEYKDSDGCVGCFWYDPLAFRKKLKITKDK